MMKPIHLKENLQIGRGNDPRRINEWLISAQSTR